MKKSSSDSTLQKIHTYALDIEQVRSAQKANPNDAQKDTDAVQQTASDDTPKQEAAIPTPPKLKHPTIRTVVHKDDSPAPTTVKKAIAASDPKKLLLEEPEVEKEKPTPVVTPTEKKLAVTETKTKEPLIHVPTQNIPEPKNDIRVKKEAAPVRIKSNNTTNQPARDSTYTATVIRDTKRARFSLWKELLKMIGGMLPTKKGNKKNNYTASTTPLRKGVVQNATTNTARKTIADYSSLKDRVKVRAPEEAVANTEPNDTAVEMSDGNDTPIHDESFKRTRSELLSSIEKEVGKIDEVPPEYLSPIHTAIDKNSVVVTPKKTAQHNFNDIQKTESALAWEHYVEKNSDEPATEILETKNSTAKETPVPVVPVPHIEQPSPAPEERITDHDTDTSPQAVEIETFSPEVPAEASSIPAPLFTQPKIEPTLTTSVTETEINYGQRPFEKAAETEPLLESPVQTPIAPAAILPQIKNLEKSSETVAPASPRKKPSNISPQSIPQKKRSNPIAVFISQYTHAFVLGGLATASVIVVGGIVITSLIAQFNAPQTTQSFHRYFNSSALYPVVVSPLSQLIITEQIAQHNNAIGVSEVVLQNSDAATVSPAILSQLLELPIDPSFNASLTDIRFGWYREEPFIVMRYTGDTIARGALLQWERTMYTDLLPLFGETPAESSLTTVFRDTTIDDTDVRALYLATGDEALLYGIVAPGHLIITTSEISFVNLTNNFNAQ